MEPMKKKEDFEGTRFPFKASIQHRAPYLVIAHWHEHLEFIRVSRGSVTVRIDRETFEAQAGDIFFFNSNQIHSVTTEVDANGNGKGEIQGMVFDKSLLLLAADNPAIRQALSLFGGSNVIRNHYDTKHPLWAELAEAMEKAYDEYTKQELAYEYGILSCIYRVMAPLLRLHQHEPRNGDAEKHAASFRRLQPAIDYMEHHYAGKVQMERVSQTVNLSPYHFSSLFKKVFGLPPIRYLTRIRIEQAKRMLLDSDIPVTDVAEKSGFCNINYFDKVFKEQTGFTPMEYRKRFVPAL
ncbi:AraC family transcriptional regulator [Paenibacillus oceani]|uniref:Helix-turn-helix transcriptional regulator n=1 Tax=Paenibacillus oceani TaxID=2772510 RepID=A0A927CAG4_9BACL|nr:AraC family transcriptional regulator [Paenibacillus oceani]MBD2863127.1 helix-turn-helix transcriptional regulator [Paenibacillus oceani]